MAVEPTKAIKIFYSYAHEDERLRNELEKHLGALKRSGLIVTWYDRDIRAGTQWEDEIDTRLNTADLILLLISHHFIDSDYCYGRELQRALERHKAGEACVIPIVLSPVYWDDTPISELQALPTGGKPITLWRDRNVAFLKIVQGIREVVKTLLNQQDEANQAIQRQSHQTIDTHEAVKLFHQLMQADSRLRILYLIGDANMGKTHLLKKVFPVLAQHQYQSRCVFFDLHKYICSVSDILNMVYEQLGSKHCSNYYKASQELMNYNKSDITSVLTEFSSFTTFLGCSNDTRKREDRLTTQLVLDFSKMNDKPLTLFFDIADNTDEQMQLWTLRTFLMKLSLLSHVRVVVATRTLLEVPSDYIDLVHIHQLHPVKEEEEYIAYCQKLHPILQEQLIRTIARKCDYTPGIFVNYLFTELVPQGR